MRKLTILVALALMVALSGLAQAKPTIGTKADAKCLAEAAKTVQQPGFNPSNYAFHGGTEADDNNIFFGQNTAGPDVFCGFGGSDHISTLDEGDIFLGGAGNDVVDGNLGTFFGGPGVDSVGTGNPP